MLLFLVEATHMDSSKEEVMDIVNHHRNMVAVETTVNHHHINNRYTINHHLNMAVETTVNRHRNNNLDTGRHQVINMVVGHHSNKEDMTPTIQLEEQEV
jgi:hypothetical protein